MLYISKEKSYGTSVSIMFVDFLNTCLALLNYNVSIVWLIFQGQSATIIYSADRVHMMAANVEIFEVFPKA